MTRPRYLPGDLAVWLLILAELAVFALLFVGFAVARAFDPATFAAGRAELHPGVGLASTLSLIVASYLVATATVGYRLGRDGTAVRLWLALLVSLAYTLGKLWEYGQLYGAGYHLGSDTFFMFYFFLTFFHFLHVVVGQGVLLALARKARRPWQDDRDTNAMESGACYWHMVDLVWLALFPLLYVVA
ncbi:MAG: cytochrome c oxidase subunit 3 [Pseudomonadales bacterium]|nr:cytochrome c oxidase subunit 3 [Pseudomonadales bacterium]